MSGALLNIVMGLACSFGLGALLWIAARNIRRAKPETFWAKDGVATALSLALVGGMVVAIAWTITGAMVLVPEPMLGALVGFIVALGGVLLPLKLLGRQPSA